MSQNNTIRKSDKKFIRTEKARIRRDILDIKKQEEMIDNLYKKFLAGPKVEEIKTEEPKKAEVKEVKKEEKPKAKKTVKKAK